MEHSINRTSVDPWIAERLGIAVDELSQEKLLQWQLASFRNML
ncbi:MAG: hypothetical protein ACOX0T_06605 [Pelotomaculum sp.]